MPHYDEARGLLNDAIVKNATLVATATHAAPSKATPVDADELPLANSASSFSLAKLTWANLKATLKTYFDSLATTLTNKTLTTPVINGFSGTGNGSVTGGLSVSGNASFGGAVNPGWGTSWNLVGLGPSNIYQAMAFGELDTYAGVYRNNAAGRLNNGTSGGAGTEISNASVNLFIFAPGVNGAAATVSAYALLTSTGLEIAGKLSVSGGNPIITTTSAAPNGAAAAVGTLNNAPVAGNPTKWIPINDNGTTRYIPAW